tara:strand:+ start:12595 stop:13008 length:414 start_codon:yes stop_codon:yes gene_type:complete
MLYGNDVDTSEIPDKSIAGAFVASFVNDEGELVAVCASDPAFVAFSGAALSMMPVGGAEDMLDTGDFTQKAVDNFYEVINVCSRLLMSDSSTHLKLDKVYRPAEAAAIVEGFTARVTVGFKLKIPRYGVGKLLFSVI